MKMQIQGLTEATITFNALGLILRGQEKAGVEVENADQRREISELVDAGVITLLNVETPEPAEPPKKRRPGRPKGSENKPKPITRAEESKPEAQAPIPKDDGSDQVSVDEQNEGDSKVTIATPSGVITAKSKHSFVGELGESEATQASLEAMKKMEAEEKGEVYPEEEVASPKPEGELSPNEQMGRKAFVGTGDKTSEVNMTNSIVPESELTKGAKFIDPESPGNESDTPEAPKENNDEVDLLDVLEDTKDDDASAFIDDGDKNNNDDVDNAFIEI